MGARSRSPTSTRSSGPKQGRAPAFTKAEAIDYYARIAPRRSCPICAAARSPGSGSPTASRASASTRSAAPKHTPDWVATAPIEMGSAGTLDFIVADDRADAGLAGAARGARAPPLARARREAGAADGARLRPRPGPAGHDRRVRPGGDHRRATCSPSSASSASRRPRARRGMQVYVPLNTPISYEDDQAVRPRARPGARALRARARRLPPEEGAAQGQGARRLEPERLLEDDRRRLLAALPRPPLGLDPAALGRGRGGRASARTPSWSASRPPTCSSGSRSTATCSRRCSS